MDLQKKPPKKNRDLLDYLTERLECCACSERASEMHHITTRGAGGGDEFTNLLPVCRQHHDHAHVKGLSDMTDKYPGVKAYLRMIKRYDDIVRKSFKLKT